MQMALDAWINVTRSTQRGLTFNCMHLAICNLTCGCGITLKFYLLTPYHCTMAYCNKGDRLKRWRVTSSQTWQFEKIISHPFSQTRSQIRATLMQISLYKYFFTQLDNVILVNFVMILQSQSKLAVQQNVVKMEGNLLVMVLNVHQHVE